MEEQKLNIFDYDDYRKFLHDYYRVQKKRNPSISYRYIARRVGFKSPGHFTQIIQGKINISIKLIDKFSEFIGFSEHETSFFRSLVLFNQAPTEEEKSGYYQKMAALKDITIVKTSETQNEYYSEIYYAAIRIAYSLSVQKRICRPGKTTHSAYNERAGKRGDFITKTPWID